MPYEGDKGRHRQGINLHPACLLRHWFQSLCSLLPFQICLRRGPVNLRSVVKWNMDFLWNKDAQKEIGNIWFTRGYFCLTFDTKGVTGTMYQGCHNSWQLANSGGIICLWAWGSSTMLGGFPGGDEQTFEQCTAQPFTKSHRWKKHSEDNCQCLPRGAGNHQLKVFLTGVHHVWECRKETFIH